MRFKTKILLKCDFNLHENAIKMHEWNLQVNGECLEQKYLVQEHQKMNIFVQKL